MTKYGRYVVIDTERGYVTWFDGEASAVKFQRDYGGVQYDTESDDSAEIEEALALARERMGVEN